MKVGIAILCKKGDSDASVRDRVLLMREKFIQQYPRYDVSAAVVEFVPASWRGTVPALDGGTEAFIEAYFTAVLMEECA